MKFQSKLAIETIKDPYNFDFLGLQEDALEKESVENNVPDHNEKHIQSDEVNFRKSTERRERIGGF
jgi:predicted nuclease of restriction endonuclease-like (RecB) superfamily